MNEKIKAAFDSVHAPREWKDGVLAQMEREAARKRPLPRRRWALAAALAFAFCLLLGGCAYLAMPVSYLSIDINPSLQLGINRLDRVVTITGYNPEGRQLASSLNLFFLPYGDAVEAILSAEDAQPYLEENLPVTIAVEGENEEKEQEILDTASNCANAHHGNVSCHHADSGLAQEARELGISLGKYQVYLELKALDPTLTPEEAQGLTMRELRERLAALSQSGEQTAPAAESQNTTTSEPCASGNGGNGSGGGQGNGNGHGNSSHGHGHGKGHGGRN